MTIKKIGITTGVSQKIIKGIIPVKRDINSRISCEMYNTIRRLGYSFIYFVKMDGFFFRMNIEEEIERLLNDN